MPPQNLEIARAAEALRKGELVAFPTETVYGLGANALDPAAVARIFEVKGRPRFNPLIVHISSPAELPSIVREVPADAQALATAFWPGPLTLVLPKQGNIPDLVTAGLDTVGVRVPSHPVAREFLRAAGVPVAAPSANRFMEISPTTADHVRASLGPAIDFILEGGPSEVGLESTIVDFVKGRARVLRTGGIPHEALEKALGYAPLHIEGNEGVLAPGMLSRHYSPHTKLVFSTPPNLPERSGLLAFTPALAESNFEAVEILSSSGDLREAASNFYAALRRLDEQNLDLIVAPLLPEEGLGMAINDRLRRAGA